jgi:tetratricopeptide (TPR) repeat protein
MLILPKAKAEEFAAMELPEEDRHLTYLALSHATDTGDRERIDQIHQQVQEWEPCPLKWDCLRTIAWHISDVSLRLSNAREAHQKFPDDQMLAFRYAEALRAAYQHQEYREFLAAFTKRGDCAGELLAGYAGALVHTPGCTEQAWQTYFRSYRKLGPQNSPFADVAQLCLINPERRHLAMGYARAAATGNPTDEQIAISYANLCHETGNLEEGLRFLRERVERYKQVSSYPRVSLADFLATVGRKAEALEVLDTAPKDGDLVSRAWLIQRHVDHLRKWGRFEQADALIEEQGSILRPQVLEELRAEIARSRGDLDQAIVHLEAIGKLMPEDDEVWAQLLELTLAVHGAEAFEKRCKELLEDPQSTVPVWVGVYDAAYTNWRFDLAHQALDQAQDAPPSEVWLLGSRNRVLLSEGRFQEALPSCLKLASDMPYSPAAWFDVAAVHRGLGNRAEAFAAYQRCWQLKPDGESTVRGLLDNADGPDHRRQLLAEMQQQCLKREPNGYVVSALARASFPEDGLEGVSAWFEKLMAAFPANEDIVREYLELLKSSGRWQLAEEKAREAMAQNPFMPGVGSLWADLLSQLGRPDEQLALFDELCQRFPHNSFLRVDFCMALEECHELQRAELEFQRAMQDFPEGVTVYGCYADFLWDRGRQSEALKLLEQACVLSASYNWAWSKRVEWLEVLNRPDEGLEVARQQVRMRPGASASHMLLADACRAVGEDEEGIAALYRALELDPRNTGLRTKLAHWHHRSGRPQQALEFLQQSRAELGNRTEFARMEGDMLRHDKKWKESRQLLRKSLDEYPDDAAAWRTFIDWLDTDDEEQELLLLSTRPPVAVAEDPFLPISIASLYIRRDESSKAIPYLEKARQQSKEHPWVLRNLLEIRRKRNDQPETRELLAEDVEYAGLRSDALAEVVASMRWLNDERWKPAYQALLSMRQSTADEIEVPWEAAPNKKAKRELLAWVWQTMQQSDEIVLWASSLQFMLQAKDKKFLARAVAAFADRFAEHEEFATLYADVMRAPLAKSRSFSREVLRRHLPDPSSDLDIWGTIGYFFCGHDPQFVVDCMHDHPFRAEARPWMLCNLADAWIELGDLDQAEAVLEQAGRWQQDGAFWYLQFHHLQLHYFRGEYQQVSKVNLRMSDLGTRDQVRCQTMIKLAEAAQAGGYFARRKVMRQHTKKVTGDVLVAILRGNFKAERDLQLATWRKLAPGLDPLLLRLGKVGVYLLFFRDA